MRPYFAYGSNMIAERMRRHCPHARAKGIAFLPGYGFRIVRSGYASLARAAAATAYGILWEISASDEQRLDTYEEIAVGLYRRAYLPVETLASGERRIALVYLACDQALGRPRTGYLEPILVAAAAHGLPEEARAELARWLPPHSSLGTTR